MKALDLAIEVLKDANASVSAKALAEAVIREVVAPVAKNGATFPRFPLPSQPHSIPLGGAREDYARPFYDYRKAPWKLTRDGVEAR